MCRSAARQSIRPPRIQGSSVPEPSTTFSVRVSSGISPSLVRSSGMNATGRATSSRPRSAGTRPATARSSSRWPFPSTAATPTISPGRTSSEPCRSASPYPLSRATSSASARIAGGPSVGCGSAAGDRGTGSPPIIAAASPPASSSSRSACSTTAPRRSTVTRSAAASASSSLCVISTAAPPDAVKRRMTSSSSATSAGASTAVGSSSSRMRASAATAFTISSRCLSPTLSRPVRTSGSSGRPIRSPACRTRSRSATGRHRPSGGERHVLGDGEGGDPGEMLVHHPDPQAPRLARRESPSGRRRRPGSSRRRGVPGRPRSASASSCPRRSRPAAHALRRSRA